MQTENNQAIAASKAGMSEKTARKYLRLDRLPSQLRGERNYRTREDGFAEVWSEIETLLRTEPTVEAKTIFEYLCRKYEGRFQQGQLRTLQRRVKRWRIKHGPGKEVMFPQRHQPGRQGQSDYTHMKDLEVTIQNQPFDHLFYHFMLTYSNWETGLVCYSESFESLSQGLQNALWELGAIPQEHRTDSLSAAVNNLSDTDEWTARYSGLMAHYGLRPSHNNPGRGHENGDVEQSHYRFKQSVGQELILRGSRDFATRQQYEEFLRQVIKRRNSTRAKALSEELAVMRGLPARRVEDYTSERTRVSRNSTMTVRHNLYSVDSRLIGEVVEVRVYADQLQVWHGGQQVQVTERLRGSGKHLVNYRHVIDSLRRKPGAFAAYRYQTDLFPSLIFRVSYDCLREQCPQSADRQYVKLLYLAREQGQEKVEIILRQLMDQGQPVSETSVRTILSEAAVCPSELKWEAEVAAVELVAYDQLLGGGEEVRQWAQS